MHNLSQGYLKVFFAAFGGEEGRCERELRRHPFTTTLKHAILTIKDIRKTWITATSASVDVHWMATGHQTPAEQPLPARNGLINLIVVQEEEQWLIAIGHSFDFTATYRRSDFGQS